MTDALRRTQAQRTAATRTALLEATIESLFETGYANVTTADISQRAGVTRGAQTHHFANKVEMVIEAIRHLTARLIAEFLAADPGESFPVNSVESFLDVLWELHRSQAFAATIELWLAARTDPELRAALQVLEVDIQDAVAATASQIPNLPTRGIAALLSTTLGTLRGLSLLTFVHADAEAEWRSAREHLIELWRLHAPA